MEDLFAARSSWSSSLFRLQELEAPSAVLRWEETLPEPPDGFIQRSPCSIDAVSSAFFHSEQSGHELEPVADDLPELPCIEDAEAASEDDSDENVDAQYRGWNALNLSEITTVGSCGRFLRVKKDPYVRGLSPQTIASSIDDVLMCGAHMRRIASFARSSAADAKRPHPATGLAHACLLLHGSLQVLVAKAHAQIESLLELASLSRRLLALLTSVCGIIDRSAGSRLEGELISALFESSDFFATQQPPHSSLKQPFLRLAVDEDDIARIEQKAIDYQEQLRQALATSSGHWRSAAGSWSDASERNEEQAVHELGPNEGAFDLLIIDDSTVSESDMPTQQSVLASRLYTLLDQADILHLDGPANASDGADVSLSSLAYRSLAPAVLVQTKVVNYLSLRRLFSEERLAEHLDLLHRFQLLSDGVFSSRLSQVLFDPSKRSGERRRHVATAGVDSGLRLGSRDSWPPASSELQLVLLGLIPECYRSRTRQDDTAITGDGGNEHADDVPGNLSFAIRQLRGEEIRQVKDPNGLEALDFLRLSYTPSPALWVIFTSEALESYDLIFKHLLRLLRVMVVARELVQHSIARWSDGCGRAATVHLFRWEANHLVQTLGGYVVDSGVGKIWQTFDAFVQQLKCSLLEGDLDGALGLCASPHRLRARHEQTLAGMLGAMFLDGEHGQAGAYLGEILRVILRFAPVSRALAGAARHDAAARDALVRQCGDLHRTFRHAVQAFLRCLQLHGDVNPDRFTGAGRVAGMADDGSDAASLTAHECLLLRLDYAGYYRGGAPGG
ncbi:hypothetical protein KEM52_006521 [Ascosphaera acerosa]|nr:hypothetical protein KEM52_006521 [Ascosphaera acerosa]